MTEKKNFWQTVPGVITGLATILTAALGLIPILSGNGNEASPEPTPSATATPSESASLTSGSSSSNNSGNTGSSAPKAVVAPKSLDFGQIGSGKTRELTVTVANSGDEYL